MICWGKGHIHVKEEGFQSAIVVIFRKIWVKKANTLFLSYFEGKYELQ